jgi:hypothetical protein
MFLNARNLPLVELMKIFFGYTYDLNNESNSRPEGSKTVGSYRGQDKVPKQSFGTRKTLSDQVLK